MASVDFNLIVKLNSHEEKCCGFRQVKGKRLKGNSETNFSWLFTNYDSKHNQCYVYQTVKIITFTLRNRVTGMMTYTLLFTQKKKKLGLLKLKKILWQTLFKSRLHWHEQSKRIRWRALCCLTHNNFVLKEFHFFPLTWDIFAGA